MRNNNLSAIKVANAKLPRSRFDLPHDVHTTADFGTTQPTLCKLMIPDSKVSFGTSHILRAAPMVAPTMGRVKLKSWSHFVPVSDLFENFTAMLAQKPVVRETASGSVAISPTIVPSVQLGLLSTIVLIGSHCTAYIQDSDESSLYSRKLMLPSFASASEYASWAAIGNNAALAQAILNVIGSVNSTVFNYTGSCYDLSILLNKTIHSTYQGSPLAAVRIPCSNPAVPEALFEPTGTLLASLQASYPDKDLTPVPLGSADMVIPCDVPIVVSGVVVTYKVYFAIRLSSFGKRLKKILIGCGYQVDIGSYEPVSLLPLMAYYKAYFDVFGLTLWQGFETTYLAQLIQIFRSYDFTTGVYAPWYDLTSDLYSVFWHFIGDLGRCWVTDDVDWVSSHVSQLSVSSTAGEASSSGKTGVFENFVAPRATPYATSHLGVVNSDSSSQLTSTDSNRGIPMLNSANHSAVDSEYLKRLYRWTNRNTVAGRRIAELLRAQGLGKFVDECKSNFIGYTESELNIRDVVSQSDTFDEVSGIQKGSQLGEYAGFGISAGHNETFSYDVDEFGYVITMTAVVPVSGYCQALDPSLTAVKKFDFYHPEFDGLGMEASKKSRVVAANDFVLTWEPNHGRLTDVFGYTPRYSGFKVHPNRINGDFANRSTRANYLPFTLDKVIGVGEHTINYLATNNNGEKEYDYRVAFSPVDVPVAGNVWRYNSRYPFLSLFNRIFSEKGNDYLNQSRFIRLMENFEALEYEMNDYDNFILHEVVNMQYYAPMLPIEDSFGTTDDEAKANGAMKKA